MSPKQLKQQGFLVPLAAIIVVGLAAIALVISRLSSQAGEGTVLQAISTQTFYAAESGAQYGAHQLLFNVSTQAAADANCAALTGTSLNFSVTGLSGCSTTITCSISNVAGVTRSFYNITSAATCGGGNIVAERSIEVSATMPY